MAEPGLSFTHAALSDLEDVWDYTAANWGVAQADRYNRALERTFGTIVAMPEIARERAEFTPPVRIHPSGEHVVVYLVEGDRVLIVRVLGARQDWSGVLGQGE